MNYTKKDIQALIIQKGLHEIGNNGSVMVIEPEKIADKYNIDVWSGDLGHIDKDICGYIRYENEKFSITIEESHHYNRKRFTLAHELGHYFMHQEILKGEGIFIDNKESMMFRGGLWSKEESEANMFAAEYLMPESEVKEMYQKYGVTEILATHFKVSLLAMAYRIDNIYRA